MLRRRILPAVAAAGILVSALLPALSAAPAAALAGPGPTAGTVDPHGGGGKGYDIGARSPGRPGTPRVSRPPSTRGGGGDSQGGGGNGCVSDGASGCVKDCGVASLTDACADFIAGEDEPAAGAVVTVTPGQLAQQANETLFPPKPQVRTAPKRGTKGMVGLPEWFWIPRSQWTSISETARAGAVWATVTASPQRMVIDPGGGIAPVTCPGPGTPYAYNRAAAGQRSDCSVLFTRSSAGLPKSAYSVTVSVVWGATWVGSGGAGGTLPEITVSTTFSLPIAEGHALNGG